MALSLLACHSLRRGPHRQKTYGPRQSMRWMIGAPQIGQGAEAVMSAAAWRSRRSRAGVWMDGSAGAMSSAEESAGSGSFGRDIGSSSRVGRFFEQRQAALGALG